MDIGKQCRIYRAAKNLTQKELALKLKISQTALSLLENGKDVPQLDADLLKKIALATANAA